MSTTHQTESGIFVVAVLLFANPPTPPTFAPSGARDARDAHAKLHPEIPPPASTFNAMPNDNTLQMGPTDVNHIFVFPDDCTLTRCSLRGSSRLGTVNSFAVDLPFQLFVDGQLVKTLFTLPAGATEVTFLENADTPIKAGAEVQFVVPTPPVAILAALENFVFSFATGPT